MGVGRQMKKEAYVNSLFTEGELNQGQLKQLGKIRYSLSTIWNNIALKSSGESSTMLFTGCSTGDGASFVSLHMTLLAATEFGLNTLYVDTDFDKRRTPVTEETLGLSNYLQGHYPLEELIQPSKVPGLSVLPSGMNSGDATCNMLTQRQYVEEVISFAKNNYQVSIFDCPPIPNSPWTISLSQKMDHVLLVARYAKSRRQVCMHSIDKLRDNGIELSGMILNERDYPIPMNIYNWLK